jgi:Zn-dependent protease with chaperone function
MKRGIFVKVLLVAMILLSMQFLSFNQKVALAKDSPSKISEQKIEEREKVGQRYYENDRIIEGLKVVLSIGVPILFLITGLSSKLSKFSKGIGKNYILTVGIYGILYNLMDSIISFPLRFYGGYKQSHAFGLSHQPFLSWIKNYLLDLALGSTIIFFTLAIVYLIIKKSTKRWWLYTGIISIPLTIFMFLAQPIIIDPLFNDFKTIENKQIEQELRTVAKKAGLEECNILTVDKSKETSMINAYMSGIGNSKRIVLWDTALNKLSIRELKFVTAHEIGHYVLGHIKKMMIIEIIVTFIMLYLIHSLAPTIINKFKMVFKFNKLSDVASFPLIILIMNIFLLVLTPSSNAYSCYIERQADAFAIELTKDNDAAISAFEKLSENGITIPNPDIIYKMWTYDHPPVKERIQFFKTYKPWLQGGELRYEEYIKE